MANAGNLNFQRGPGFKVNPGGVRAPAINLGGGQGFRSLASARARPAPQRAINLAALGVKPVRPARQANPIAQAKARANLNFTPRLARQNPIARARAMGRGF